MATSATTSKLRAGLNTLPQELYDTIYDLTFTSSPRTIYIHPTSQSAQNKRRAPQNLATNLLRVDSASRNQYQTSYYTNTIFRLDSPKLCIAWIHFMPSHHRPLVRVIHCMRPAPSFVVPPVRGAGMVWSPAQLQQFRIRAEKHQEDRTRRFLFKMNLLRVEIEFGHVGPREYWGDSDSESDSEREEIG
ncbi:uncharacterized protein RCC_01318 [Ramularia collo-cygni]|uniref:Uncharacterized protein n=1 Tax=Ramularia collo-cygni TaxID=112498 RepID=A0A2D3ULT2_9PEZI|nr:uncharacterized protein RCC_01318 [Ramularia collo-cygni]CZT15462.1 uncharacterized protein RCC_01318 [Ramularia collo-cygni]